MLSRYVMTKYVLYLLPVRQRQIERMNHYSWLGYSQRNRPVDPTLSGVTDGERLAAGSFQCNAKGVCAVIVGIESISAWEKRLAITAGKANRTMVIGRSAVVGIMGCYCDSNGRVHGCRKRAG